VSRSATASPTASHTQRSPDETLLLVRVGDAQLGVHNTAPGTALAVTFDYVDARGIVWRSVELPRNASRGRTPCTLSHGDEAAGSTSWWLDTEGLPSRASETEDVVMLPCHASPAGTRFAELVRDTKSIATLGASPTRDDVATLPFVGYTGVRGTATGLRQAASRDGRSGFWVAGIANSRYGVRYVAPGSVATTRVHGATFYSPPGASVETLRYQPATLDVRGLGVYGAQLLLTSSYVVERNRNMPAAGQWRGWTPWGGLVLVGDDATARAPPTSSQSLSVLARGFTGRRNYWTFVFESDRSLWLLEDTTSYRPATGGGGSAEAAKPVNVRTALGTAVVRWVWRDGTWQEEPAARVTIPGATACYSLAGRVEGAATGWVVYTTSRTTLYRLVTATRALTELRRAPAGSVYRGVVLPPLLPRGGAAHPGSLAAQQRAPASLSLHAAPVAGEAPPPAPPGSSAAPPAGEAPSAAPPAGEAPPAAHAPAHAAPAAGGASTPGNWLCSLWTYLFSDTFFAGPAPFICTRGGG
jgi:hypothetical protein